MVPANAKPFESCLLIPCIELSTSDDPTYKTKKTCKFIRWKDINLFFHLLLTMSLSPTVGVFSIHTTYASWLSYDE